MSEFSTPTQIAREALRRLAVKRRAPTPDHFRELYDEISGAGAGPAAPAIAPAHAELCGLVADLVSSGPLAHLAEQLGMGEEGRLLAGRARAARDHAALLQLRSDIAAHCARLEATVLGERDVREGLLRVLRLLVDNVSALIVEDTWVLCQLEVMREMLARPANMDTVRSAEAFLREVLLRQSGIKNSLREAKEALRQTVESILGHLGSMVDDTGGYRQAIESHAERIRGAHDIGALGAVIADLLKDTRAMQERTQAAEARISELEGQLVRVSDELRVDHLTGTLNRRGFEETFVRMVAESRRNGGSLCLALLDVDNFKQLNDRHGHAAGDDALVHLTRVVRNAIRPSDSIARHGGEEFVVLLPDTELTGAEALMVRLQRELTRQYFMHGNERILITFSAGVAQWTPGESLDSALQRVDAAQYQAKATGKNKVVIAPAPAAAGAAPVAAGRK